MKTPTGFRSCLRRPADVRWLLLVLISFTLATARGVTVTAFDPSTWPRTDAALGVSGFTIEDFEDTTLVSGLQVQLSGGTADFGPTSTLPHAFDPNADDLNPGKVLVPCIWDGSHVLMNRRNAPIPVGYVDGEWADITFVFTAGASSVGFSVEQLEAANTMMTVTTSTGTTSFNLSNIPNFTTAGGGRNAYLRIFAGVGEAILSVKIDNLNGDGFAFDHLAFKSANLLTNGSFEDTAGTYVDQGSGSMILPAGSTTIPGWRVISNPTAWFKNTNPFGIVPVDGSFAVDLTGSQDNTNFSGVTQTIATTPGQNYTLSFALGSNNADANQGGSKSVLATAGSASQSFTFVPSGATNQWGTFSLQFVATSTTTTVTIAATGSGSGDDYLGLDNVSVVPSGAPTTPVQFTNGHYYQPFAAPGGITWEDAQAAARAMGGYLATNLSAAENTFVFNLIDDPKYWFNDGANNSQGPWIGGFQPTGSSEPAGGWQWVNNDGPFVFTNWAGGEPSNGGGNESRLQFFGTGLNNRQPTWNDDPPAPVATVLGFVVEFDSFNGLRPIAHWKFDEVGGGIARDSAGSFDGTLAGGAAFVNGGISGNAISVNPATNGLVNAGTSFPGFLAGDFTIVAWVKTTDATGGSVIIAGKHNGGSENGYFLFTNPTGGGGATGKATLYASEFANQAPTSTTTVTDGQWHQVVGVYRGGGVHTIYVDGSPAEASTASHAMVANTSAFVIGGVGQNSSNNTPAGSFNGLIDDVQVYDAALTDAQIDFLFTHPGQEFQPMIYDLKTDWSDAMNPNCTWTYREGNNAMAQFIVSTGDFSGAQKVWASAQGGIPAWFKSVGAESIVHDWLPGDVVVHTQDDFTSPGKGNANVTWTSPINDTITITGGVWEGRDIGRGNDWFLYKNNTLLTQGHIESGDVYSRANLFLLSAGSGGAAAVTNIAVVAGDVIKLELVKTSAPGDYVGVNLTITGSTLVPAPEVTTNAATNVAGTTVTLNGAANPNGTDTSVYFEYGTTTGYGSTTAAQNIGCGTSAVAASANLTGLTIGALYHFRAVAVTSAGTFYGEDATFAAVRRPIAHYKFDESSGTIAKDSAGTFDGTLAGGAAFVTGGISGNAISLDKATNSLVNMGTSFPGFTSGDFSIIAWVKTTDTTNDAVIVAKHEGGTQNGYFLVNSTSGGSGTSGKATFYTSPGSTADAPLSTTTVTDGQWHQLVGVYHSGAMHSIYVDGSPAESSTVSQALVGNGAPFIIGGFNLFGTPTPAFTGLIDGVQVYDFALSDTQIDFLFGHPGLEVPDITRTLFRDDFNGSIDPAWAITRSDAAYRTINPSELDLRASSGDLYTNSNNAKNVFLVTNPTSGDFTITVRVNSFAPANANNAQIDLLAFDDDDNHVRANYGFIGGQRQIEFGKEVAANPGYQGTPLDLGNGAFFMRLTKVGTSYTQSYSTDGSTFTAANSPLTFGDGTPAKLGFVVDADPSETSRAHIDFFAIETYVPPTVTSDAASSVVATSAMLNGTVNPNSAATTYFFQYGTDTNYGSTTSTQSAGGGPNAVAVSAPITGLMPNTTYHFRLVANSSGSTFNGADAMFTTPASPPTVTTGTATDVRVHRATLRGTLDPQGTGTSYFFEYGPNTNYGSVTPTVDVGTTSGAVNATITGLAGATTVHFRLVGKRGATTFPGSDATFTTLTPGITAVAVRGDFAPNAAGTDTTATFFSFGPPAIANDAAMVFRATLTKNVGGVLATNDTGIWLDSASGTFQIAREGAQAPDATEPFASFGEPVIASGSRIAFLARLKAKTKTTGIWSNVSGGLHKIARQGDPAPGTNGATFASFISVALPEVGGPVFIAKLKGATPATDVGIFAANSAGVVQPVLVREGDMLAVGAAQKTVAMLQFLPPMKLVSGQTRGFNGGGTLCFRVTFTDKTKAVFRPGTLIAATGTSAPGVTGATFASFSQPAIEGTADLAFLGTMTIGAGGVTKANDTAIFSHVSGPAPELVAREGNPAPTLAAKFASFSDPVANAGGDVAFLARLKVGTGDAVGANASVICAESASALTLVARQGKPAPGTTANFTKFTALALPDLGGPVFFAKLKRSKTVTATNDAGIWAGDFAGGLTLVTRTGGPLTVGSGQKTVKQLKFLPSVLGVPGQTRNFNADGYLAFRALFTDRTEGIFKVLR